MIMIITFTIHFYVQYVRRHAYIYDIPKVVKGCQKPNPGHTALMIMYDYVYFSSALSIMDLRCMQRQRPESDRQIYQVQHLSTS